MNWLYSQETTEKRRGRGSTHVFISHDSARQHAPTDDRVIISYESRV